jgi:thioredoxin 2
MANLADLAAVSLQVTCPSCLTETRMPVGGAEDALKCSWCGATLSTTPAELNEATFSPFIAHDDRPVLVNFWAPWSSPCRTMTWGFRQAATALRPRARLAEVNIEEAPEFADRMGVYTVPTLILFRDGRELDRLPGPVDFEDLLRWISGHS